MIRVAGKHEAYMATPHEGNAHRNVALLYCPDVMGIWQNSKLMADQFAANGYPTMIIDTFNRDAIPLNRPADFDIMKWIKEGSDGCNPHTPECVDLIVQDALRYLKEVRGAAKIGALGYCLGAKYVVRHYNSGVEVGFVAHPSLVEEDELAAIRGPLSIAAAETDSMFPAEKRHRSEEILKATAKAYQINLFGGVAHGFAVRGDMENRVERFAKEQAFLQAISWFNWHLL